MKFEFFGDENDFKNKLQYEIIASGKDIRFETEKSDLSIGFQRLGHSGGRWFVANTHIADNHFILDGEFKNIYLSSKGDLKQQSKITDFLYGLVAYLVLYLILFGLFTLIWTIAKLDYFFIAFVLPTIILAPILFIRVKGDNNIDNEFISFMKVNVGCNYIE